MQTTVLPRGALVLDAAGFVSLNAVIRAVQMPQCAGCIFYNGGRYGVSAQQLHATVDNGKLFATTIERRPDEALYNSPGGAGIVDLARAGLDAWGMPHDTSPTILSCVDFGASQSQWAQLDRFHYDAVVRAEATDTWIAYYGQTAYGSHLSQQDWWGGRPTWSWGGAGTIPGTALKQKYGYPSGVDWSPVGVTVDESEGLAGLMMVASFESGPPSNNGGDMKYLWPCNDAGAVFYGDFDGKVGYSVRRVTGDEVALYQSIGVPSMAPRSRNEFKHLILDGEPPEAWRGQDPIFQGWDDSYFRWVNGRQPAAPPTGVAPHHHALGASTGPAVPD